jgi:hypothetical protein
MSNIINLMHHQVARPLFTFGLKKPNWLLNFILTDMDTPDGSR